jgi:hypothetical protein
MARVMASEVHGRACSLTNGNGTGGTHRLHKQAISPGGHQRIISQGGCGSVQGQHVVMHGTRTQNSFAPNVEQFQDVPRQPQAKARDRINVDDDDNKL